MVVLMGFVLGKRFRRDKMECGLDRLRGDGQRGVGVEVGDNNERRERGRESDAVL